MKTPKKQRLEAAGYAVGDAADFLGLTAEELALVELRLAVSRAFRDARGKRNLTQQQVAELMESSQSRVAKMEAAAGDVTLDLMFRGLFAVGGTAKDVFAGVNGKAKRMREPKTQQSTPRTVRGTGAKRRPSKTTNT